MRLAAGKRLVGRGVRHASGFLVTPRVTSSGGQGGSAGCFYPNKESYFWARWGADRATTLRAFVGPELPLSRWGRHGECDGTRDTPSLSVHAALPRGEFPFEKHVDDLCLLDGDDDAGAAAPPPPPSVVRHAPRGGGGRSPRPACDAATAAEEGQGGHAASSSSGYRAAVPSACRRLYPLPL